MLRYKKGYGNFVVLSTCTSYIEEFVNVNGSSQEERSAANVRGAAHKRCILQQRGRHLCLYHFVLDERERACTTNANAS